MSNKLVLHYTRLQAYARSVNKDIEMKRYDKEWFKILGLMIWDKKCGNQKCII